jgi:hypothetical protein
MKHFEPEQLLFVLIVSAVILALALWRLANPY